MSAFIVDKSHIDAIMYVAQNGPADRCSKYAGDGWAAPYFRYGNNPTNMSSLDARHETDAIGKALWLENHTSVSYRYPDSIGQDLPGPIGLTLDDIDAYSLNRRIRHLTTVEALKALDGYEYQACEHPEWENSPARRFIEHLRGSLISCLPGYDEAAWSVEED